jgi:UDP-N-acetyl-D-mannosaminuronate dehydrogenase
MIVAPHSTNSITQSNKVSNHDNAIHVLGITYTQKHTNIQHIPAPQVADFLADAVEKVETNAERYVHEYRDGQSSERHQCCDGLVAGRGHPYE